MANKYWNGSEHAVLKKEDVSADWIKARWGAKGLGATNKAFCLWYHGRKTVTETGSSAMRKSLEECGYTGWGVGVNDLDEAFKHLEKNGGRWTDNTTSSFGSYNGKRGDYTGSGNGLYIGSESIHPSISSFLTAVDKALADMKNAMHTYQKQCQALQAAKVTPQSPKSDWEKVKKNVDLIKGTAEKISKYAWLAPATIEANLPMTSSNLAHMKKASDFTDALTKRADQTVKFADAVGKIHDALTLYTEATKTFDGNQKVGVAFGALSIALTYVPVLGGFYGEIVKRIPGLAAHWKVFIADYTSRSLNPIAYQMKEAKKPAPWKCATCGSM